MAAFRSGLVVAQDSGPAIDAEIVELGLAGIHAYRSLFYECLQLALHAPLESYRQPSPPKSTKGSARGLPMWAFVVSHPRYRRLLYLKFSLKPTCQGCFCIHISLHEDRFPSTPAPRQGPHSAA